MEKLTPPAGLLPINIYVDGVLETPTGESIDLNFEYAQYVRKACNQYPELQEILAQAIQYLKILNNTVKNNLIAEFIKNNDIVKSPK